MSCALEQIAISGLSRTGLDPNGVYVKSAPFFGVPIVYEKAAGGNNLYRLWGPVPFAGNTYLLQYLVNGASNVQFAASPPGQSAVCPDLLTGWVLQSAGFINGQPEPGTTGSVIITEYTSTPQNNNIPSTDPITLRNNKYATANESGANRFRRLVALGYV